MDSHRPGQEATPLGGGGSPRAAIVISLACAVAFGLLAWNAVADVGLARVDPHVQGFVVGHRVRWLTHAFRALTWLGSTPVLALVVVTLGVFVAWRRKAWLDAALPAGALLLTAVAKNWAKVLVARPRPPASLAIGSSTGFAFPSGHAADSLAAFAMLAVILSAGVVRPARFAVWAGAAAVILAVGASRVYLGVHWLTDVLGGWALAGAIVSILSVPRSVRLRPPTGPART